ncbi:protein kinase [Streptomyces sp. MUM 203J]|uniref:serine/threonine-protein kinase n=1 Tax=Streptomyces sp. MUM 203J TaxID=2791990 RepID=UPI001F033891|nr:serine/threonine-protein kinase [Streptomyces sp. MUM 203J]MCH0541594.1 protein kinase [Streptomyces sp. MUM 203J]
MLRPLDADAPRTIGPYRLLAALGSGGMGSVHLAVPHGGGPDDLVALKTVRPDLELEGDFRLRFRREAEAARAVRGPYVSALVDADPEAPSPWLATRYVAGPSLDEAVSRHGPLPAPVVRELGAALARGLAAVHGARLVHRDLKPGNVVLGTGGPRLIDFGIAQAYDATALTATGIMVGSPGFMSPEHIAGNRSVTTASDVFCLGAVLCFAATGHGPFEDTELAAIVHRIARGQADLTRVPAELRDVVAACLRQDPGGRPTTGELVRVLDPASAAARPGAAAAHRTGPFPWPDGVGDLIGAYQAAAGRALAAPPARPVPPRPPGPPATPASAAAVARTGARRRWAVGAGLAVVLAGALTAVLVNLPDGERRTPSEAGGKTGETPVREEGRAREESPARTGTPSAPAVSSDMGDFGPDALDRTRQPEGWRPWAASFDVPGEAQDCALSGAVFVCRLWDEGGKRMRLEARNAADGTHLWRYPAEDAAAGRGGARSFDLDARQVYVGSSDEAGFDVLDLDDGRQVGRLPGRIGYRPEVARVHAGRVFTSYAGEGGPGTAINMLFRAYAVEGGAQQWERVIPMAYPQQLDVAGGRVRVPGPAETLVLDPETGKTVARTPSYCDLPPRGALYLSCGSGGIWDARTLEEVSGVRVGAPQAVSRDGLFFVEGTGLRKGSPYLRALHARTGREQWAVTWSRGDRVGAAGDRFVMFGAGTLRTFALADGTPGPDVSTFQDWPREGGSPTAPRARPGTALVSGRSFFLTFEDGTILSASVP